MHLIDGAGHVNNQFVAEDVPSGRPPTEITADFMNALQNELASFILSAGKALNKNNNEQLRDTLYATFARSDSTIHYVGDIYNIVADQATLGSIPIQYLPDGVKVLVTNYYGLHQAAMMTLINGSWVDTPTPLKVFDLYACSYDNHGYYWFAGAWNLFDVSAIQVEEATEVDQGIIKLATWAEVLAGSLAAVAMRPRHMIDYIDRMFIGMFGDFSSGATPPPVWVPVNGQLINRTERPLLWQHAQNSGILVADSAWASDTGKFSSGNGTSTFRVPDLRGKFRRSADQGRGVDPGRLEGTDQEDAIREHRHINGMAGNSSGMFAYGAFAGAQTSGAANQSGNGSGYPYTSITGGTETRPCNLAYPTHIYAGAPAT